MRYHLMALSHTRLTYVVIQTAETGPDSLQIKALTGPAGAVPVSLKDRAWTLDPATMPIIVDDSMRAVWAHPDSLTRAFSYAAREADAVEATITRRTPRERRAVRYNPATAA
jgi:hypothetical protein